MKIALEGRGLTKRYRDHDVEVLALDDIDVEVAAGEFVAVMGPSGSGKSTLLHLLGGLDRPSEGEVLVDGRPLAGLSATQLAVLRSSTLGFVFQLYNLIPSLTVAENVALPAIAGKLRPKSYEARVSELLELVGLSGKHDRFPSHLSGGEQQRVAVARALVREPAVVLADEPTGNLDTATGESLMALFAKAHSAGQTIVLVTHDPKVASAAQRILFMRDGRIVQETTLDPAKEERLAALVELGNETSTRGRSSRTTPRT